MKAWISTVSAVAFLSTSSIALAGQTMTPRERVERGAAGAVIGAAGFTLHGTVEHAGAPWALHALSALGVGTATSTVLVAGAGSAAVGVGIYQITRGIVGTDPENPLKMGLPGFVSGGVLTAIGVEGIVQLGVTVGFAAAGVGLALAATSIIAAVGVGFVGYGAYQYWKAAQAKKAASHPDALASSLPATVGPAGSNVGRHARTVPLANRLATGLSSAGSGGPGAGLHR